MRSYYSMHSLCLYLYLLFIHAFAYSYLALASVFLFCPYSAHCSFSFISLFTFIWPYYLVSYLVHLGAPITHLPIFSYVISSCPSYLAVFLGFLFIRFPFFSPFQCSTLPPSSPTLHHHLPLLHSLLLSPPSFTHLSTSFLTFSLIFLHPHFLSPSFYIFGATYVWPFSVILWLIFEDFCTLQYLTILHLIYDAKYVYISSLFLQCVGNNWLKMPNMAKVTSVSFSNKHDFLQAWWHFTDDDWYLESIKLLWDHGGFTILFFWPGFLAIGLDNAERFQEVPVHMSQNL